LHSQIPVFTRHVRGRRCHIPPQKASLARDLTEPARRLLMSLHPQPIPPVPEETARVARTAFPHGSLYLVMRDELGAFFTDDDFATLFPTRGQPAEAPWRLALVTVMPWVEEVSDRHAAEVVRSRIDWKYALS